jgi:hypothetical protein
MALVTCSRQARACLRAWFRALCACLLLLAVGSGRSARADARESSEPARVLSPALAAGLWTAVQLIPSPLLVIGGNGLGGGLRWQITPLVYSFGVAARPLRAFVIEPVARHTGAVELYFSPEWACCAPQQASSWLARGGARLYWPLLLSGESLSGSLGGSYYFAQPHDGAALEVGIYTLASIFGFTLTVAPTLAGREVIAAFTLHYY